MPTQYRTSASAIELLRAGIPQHRIAEVAGITQAEVSRQLSGRRPLRDRTLGAIRQLAGHDLADRIADLAEVAS